MKRYSLFLTMLFLAAVACKKDEIIEGGDPVPEPGTAYLLEGTVKTEGFTWKTNSTVGLYSAMDAVRIINKECKIVGWADTTPIYDEDGNNTNDYTPSEYEGKAVARFNTPALDLVQGQNKFMVYSPYNNNLTYTGGTIYGLSVGDNQQQTAPNVAADCFAIGYATGTPGVDEAFSFELNPVTAIAQVKIGSSEFVGYSPKKVSIYDDSGTTIAGGFNINVETNEIQQAGEGLKSVAVEVINPVALASGQTQNIYLNILPVDFSNKDVWVIVELVDAAGGKITIPTKQKGLKFAAGQITEIDLSDIKTADNAAGDWYCPDDSRLLPGLGYAYGQANTFFIQCKSGIYNGASLTPNPDIPEEVVIDYRVRGNFASITEDMKPEGVSFEWFTLSNGNIYAPRMAGYESSNVVISNSTFTFEHKEAEKTVTVKNNGAFAGSPVLVMKKNGKILWAWSFWNVAADGTSIEPVQVGNYKFAPMDIGQATTDIEKWIANKNGSNPDPVYRTIHFYQWGRPYPLFWTTYWSLDGIDGKAGNIPAVLGPVSLADALSTPALVAYPGTVEPKADWCSDTYSDLWGAEDVKEEGAKTIYDPCPKGWRVASVPALQALADLAGTASFSDEQGKVWAKVGDLTLITHGYQSSKDPTGKTQHRPENMGLGQTANSGDCKEAIIWSNVAGTEQGQDLYYTSNSTKNAEDNRHTVRIASHNKVCAAAVRCIKDDDNR